MGLGNNLVGTSSQGNGSSNQVSSRVGEFVHAKTGRDSLSGYLAVVPGTVVNGASDYPVWAALYPELVVGADIVFPDDVAGMFLRNTGGNAAQEGDLQPDENKPHTHTYTRFASIPTNSSTGGNNGRWRGTAGIQTASSGSQESRPINRAYQLYTIVDSYVA